MLVYEAGGIIDLVMYNNVQILLCVVLGNVRVGELLVGRHGGRRAGISDSGRGSDTGEEGKQRFLSTERGRISDQ